MAFHVFLQVLPLIQNCQDKVYFVCESVFPCVLLAWKVLFLKYLRHPPCGAACRSVKGKRPCVRKTVKICRPWERQRPHVGYIFGREKNRFLTIFKIDSVADAILNDSVVVTADASFPLSILARWKSFPLTDGNVAAHKFRRFLAVFFQDAYK